MKIYPVQNLNLTTGKTHRIKAKTQCCGTENPNFKGWKGAAIGAGAGALYAGIILAMTATTMPLLAGIMAADLVAGGTGVGALAGHLTEKEFKNDNKKD